MEELCQPSLNGQGDLIASIAIQATKFGLKNDMIQQVQNSCQFHGLPGDDANKHLDKFMYVTQSIKMAKMFLGKYFPPSMVTKLRNEITNFRQRLDESLSVAWEHYKLSIRCPNHNMLPVTQIDTFYNSLTLRHHDTINAAAGGTFMKRRPEECYDLIENMTAHHNDWDTLAQRSESSSSITSSFDTKIAALKAKMAEINKNLMRVLQVNLQVKAVTPNCETCGGPHSFSDCPTIAGNTQNVYAAGAYQDGEAMINSIQNGDQPLPVIAQVSLAGTPQNAPPTLKDLKFWTAEEKKTRKIDRLGRSLLIQGLPNDIYSLIDSNETAKDLWDALESQMRSFEYGEQDRKAIILYECETFKAIEGERLLDTYPCYLQVINDLKKCGYKKDNCELNYKFLNNLQQEWKQYATLMRQTKNLMDINIDALYNILKKNQGNLNDALGYKKKAVVVHSDPLALVIEKKNVSKQKEKVVVSSDSKGSGSDVFSELKKITALLAKAFNRRKFYSKPTNNNLRTSSTSQSANKKQEFVKTDNKKDDEKKRDMSRVKCYNCKKEGHFAKDCKKVKVKDYEYYKTKMLLAKKNKDKQVLLAED
nr:reverse transcriptase domain-containing protein [Tanacetum cinerariifolium]